MRTEINFVLGKNGGYIPNSLGGWSISVGRQAGSYRDENFHDSITLIQ